MEPETQQAADPTAFVQNVTSMGNLVEMLEPSKRAEIAMNVLDDYEIDKRSMRDWLKGMKEGLELASLMKGDKTYPFKNSSNIKYPLVTSAALQFNARAYPAIVPAEDVVKATTFGADPQGKKAARAKRVASHMSYQLLCRIEEWESETDRLLVQLPIVGTVIRKTWYDSEKKRTRSRVVKPGRFIVNDTVSCLEDAPRMSEEIPLYPNEIKARIRNGTFVPFDWTDDSEDKHAPQHFVEQHLLLDMDEDGYDEPYIAMVHKETQNLVRLVADFDPEDVTYKTQQSFQTTAMPPLAPGLPPRIVTEPVEIPVAITDIRRGTYFTDYHFLPSMNGGFWGTGLGLLLGDISSSINSIINMLIDAGHYASLGGGFIGSEFRIKGGHQKMEPGEWRMTSSRGVDLRNAIVPLNYPGPDATLFSLLGLLIEAGREVASVKDILTGDAGGKTQTATTTLALIEQGLMVFTAAYKRIYLSLKKEFRVIAKINAVMTSREEYNAFHDGEEQYDPKAEYAMADMDILPVADPRSVTKMQEAAKAQMVMELADRGLVDPVAASQRVLDAAEIGDTEQLQVKPDPMAEPMQQLQLQSAQAEVAKMMADIELTMAKVMQAKSAAVKNVAEAGAEENRVEIERYNATLKMLEMQRDALAETLSGGRGTVA